MIDSHVHSKGFSCDSSLDINDFISMKEGSNIILTEHMDLDYLQGGRFVFNPEEYFNSYNKYRGKRLLLGIEIGLSEKYLQENNEIIKKYPFDYVLGSLHFVDEIDVFDKRFYAKKSKEVAYREYLNEAVRVIDLYDDIDSFAHFDYIARYSPYEDRELYYEDFKEEITNLFTKIIEKGIILELNTKRLTTEKTINEYIKIFKFYKKLGGRYVTIGSDSHFLNNIAFNFNAAYKIIGDLGLKQVYFKERKMMEINDYNDFLL
ncbi:MAG: histidinol-phosphatase HisJ family protein [Oscillospiraceae bacterium]|nr:histidinol-phosphatase HisJ family protein [Oscillospiraceae bacterium]